jgi:hypothetical protein
MNETVMTSVDEASSEEGAEEAISIAASSSQVIFE